MKRVVLCGLAVATGAASGSVYAADVLGELASRIGRPHLPADALEQAQTELRFECVNLMADRTVGEIQLGRRARIVLMAHGGFERAQRSQRR